MVIPQTTDMNLRQAHCLASQAPALDLWLEITKIKNLLKMSDSFEFESSSLKYLLYYKPKRHRKANR